MKVLTATARSQGARPGDFDWCVEGELVWVPEPCGEEGRRTDGGPDCGCSRAFAGMASHASTTTAVVRELPELTRALLVEILRTTLADQGWPRAWAESDALELIELAGRLQEGDIVERDRDTIGRRFHPVSGRLLAPLSRRA